MDIVDNQDSQIENSPREISPINKATEALSNNNMDYAYQCKLIKLN